MAGMLVEVSSMSKLFSKESFTQLSLDERRPQRPSEVRMIPDWAVLAFSIGVILATAGLLFLVFDSTQETPIPKLWERLTRRRPRAGSCVHWWALEDIPQFHEGASKSFTSLSVHCSKCGVPRLCGSIHVPNVDLTI